ncbi:C26 family cysteine hydrolase domain-containing family [Calidifontibacter sp. DB0510]|uniref:aminodeoxychorismate synthase n=1 Tax=Metallococcus carri TaxID=1656884 RepID=A0A967B0F3_9MICO|nr:chorismate-binding protein [Metallococcus carri]NHN55123.1 C26 family cysteine hydrolase domain-containing family [Metallococcus carri]NOP36200.1 C26 family cysteine hydrolase domain-containing family [Calidifontibacter sp. DB2511S]
MDVLVIDNHDSFTFNLVELLRAHDRVQVTVQRNDEPLPADWAARFDAVVISPGPGRPDVLADVGCSREVVEHAALPVLGVCLGHQLIASLHGCPVAESAHPRHGEVSPVTHDRDPLFAGIPDTFEVVRYHSLDVPAVRAPVRPLAYADDGTLMALRVADQPLWGVQFHPESIRSAWGHTLIGNFLRLAGEHARSTTTWRQRSRQVPAVGLEQVLAAGPAPRVVLDGVIGHTLVGWDVGSHELQYRCGGFARIVSRDGAIEDSEMGLLDLLERRLGGLTGEGPVRLGYAGYLGYELGVELLGHAALPSDELPAEGPPDGWLALITRGVLLAADGEVTLVGLDDPNDPASVAALDEWFTTTTEQLAESIVGQSYSPPTATDLRWTEPADYLALIARCQDAITRGESYELCLTHQVRGRWTGDPLQLFLTLRAGGTVPYAAFLDLGDGRYAVSGSPELFLSVDAHRHAVSRPIKGTRATTGDPARDPGIRQELAESAKDRAENLMIVDLVRNDFARVAVPGSTTVTELFGVHSFPTVLQMISTIECDLPPGVSAVQLVRSAFPPGSMTGAPKARSVAILRALEGRPRGIYSGTIGLFGLDGSASLNVAIRTIVLDGGDFSIGVGGAITRLSDPQAEWRETVDKARSSLTALGATMGEMDGAGWGETTARSADRPCATGVFGPAG